MGTAGVSAAGGGVVWNDPDLANASYDGVSFSLSPYTANRGIFFKDDGTKMYVVSVGNGVLEYNLSTAWDTSTASYNQVFDVSSQEGNPNTIFFKDDGTKMYILGRNGDDVNEYNLSTAWDVSSASYSQVFSVASQESNPFGMFFKPDGLKLYIIGLINTTVFEYTLTTAWDVSTASYSSNSFSISSQDTAPREINFNDDGTKMYMLGATNDAVFEYDLSTAWDVSSASYNSVSFSVSSQETSPTAFRFKSDGSKMYVVGALNTVYQYTTPAAASWTDPDIANASYDSVSFSVASQQINSRGVTFKSDGTKLYVVGSNTNIVYAYDLSTAWDITTATYNSENGSVNSQETNASDLIFKPDGTKMYALGSTSDTVYQYSLSTAWDVSTLSYDNKSISITSQDATPTGIIFKSDGTSFYMCGSATDNIYQYDMTTAYDISTASYANKSVSVSTNPLGLFLNPNDDQIYYCDSTSDLVYAYDLTTAGDLSTAVNTNTSFSTGTQMTACQGINFKSDGSKAYVIDYHSNTIYQYST